MDAVRYKELDPVLLDLDAPRLSQHLKYGGDILPNVEERDSGVPFLEFFQQETATGIAKGIIEMTLGGEQ